VHLYFSVGSFSLKKSQHTKHKQSLQIRPAFWLTKKNLCVLLVRGFLQVGCSFCHRTNSIKSLKAPACAGSIVGKALEQISWAY